MNIIAMTCMCVDVFDDTGEKINLSTKSLSTLFQALLLQTIGFILLRKVIDISKMIHGTVVFMTHIFLAILTRTESQVLIIFITFDSPNFDDVLELRKSCRFQLAVDFNVLRGFKKIETIVPYIDFFFISGEKSILLQFQKWSEQYDNIFNITLAENGSVTYYMGKEYRVDAVPVNNVIDTTGCGDSYHAGFLCSYLRDCDIINAMNEGSRVASKTLSPDGYPFLIIPHTHNQAPSALYVLRPADQQYHR